jgi:hypothetical protein
MWTGQDIGLPFLGLGDRFCLVGEQEWLVGVVAPRLVEAENLRALRMQSPFAHSIIDGPARQKGRVQLQARLWPQRSLIQGAIDFVADALIRNLDAERVQRQGKGGSFKYRFSLAHFSIYVK